MKAVRIASIRPPWHQPPARADPLACLPPRLDLLRQAAREGAQLILFPEDALNMLNWAQAQTHEASVRRAIAEAAEALGVFVAFPLIRHAGGRRYNATAIFGPNGQPLGHYDKTHPILLEVERYGVTAGDALPVFDLGLLKVGVMTCSDVLFPEVARDVALAGAEVVLFPHQMAEPDDDFFRVMVRARAQDNCVPIVCSSFADQPSRHWFRNYAIDARGRIVAEGPVGEGFTLIDITPGTPVTMRDYIEPGPIDLRDIIRRYRRPELYGPRPFPSVRAAPAGAAR